MASQDWESRPCVTEKGYAKEGKRENGKTRKKEEGKGQEQRYLKLPVDQF